jgi:hypothetical protein
MSGLSIHKCQCVCANPDCDREWARDPILEVPCPDCHAGIGAYCKRPSGHSGPFVEAHASRDLAADRAGAMFARGAVLAKEASFAALPAGISAIASGPIQTAFTYNGAGGLLSAIGSYLAGVAIGQNSLGVSIITDA